MRATPNFPTFPLLALFSYFAISARGPILFGENRVENGVEKKVETKRNPLTHFVDWMAFQDKNFKKGGFIENSFITGSFGFLGQFNVLGTLPEGHFFEQGLKEVRNEHLQSLENGLDFIPTLNFETPQNSNQKGGGVQWAVLSKKNPPLVMARELQLFFPFSLAKPLFPYFNRITQGLFPFKKLNSWLGGIQKKGNNRVLFKESQIQSFKKNLNEDENKFLSNSFSFYLQRYPKNNLVMTLYHQTFPEQAEETFPFLRKGKEPPPQKPFIPPLPPDIPRPPAIKPVVTSNPGNNSNPNQNSPGGNQKLGERAKFYRAFIPEARKSGT